MLKKQAFKQGEIPIFDDAIIYTRGAYWHFRMWLAKERKYVRVSLKTRSQTTAIERAKSTYLKVLHNLEMGKTYFSLTAKQGVEQYLANRKKDVELGLIVPGRLMTISTHLNHWLKFIGPATKLKEMDRNDCEDYFYFRSRGSEGRVKQLTVQNEQSSINACIKWLNRQGEIQLDHFDFKKLPRLDKKNDAIRRETLNNDEYKALYQAMRRYTRRDEALDEHEWMTRQLIRHYVLVAANSGLRTGEQRQLRWSDVSVERRQSGGLAKLLMKVQVRAETSKVRSSRTLFCKGGQYLNRLRQLTQPQSPSDYVFSLDGKTMVTKRTILYQFKRMMDLADIKDWHQRGIVPYSLRHFMITQRIMSGLTYRQVAEMCGTSITQIENTYYHLNDEIRLTNALADYRRNPDGTIQPI
jgi:integrase